nr:PREDICTED: DNA helicase B [Latimeria chalumnae]|eukprot:XP_006013856.2 PREDICTED: DNA helicase B [Latimeria chalumnae]
MLADLFASLSAFHWAIELKTNHRTESQLIIDNASRIADGGQNSHLVHLKYDAVIEIGRDSKGVMPSADKRFILVDMLDEDSDLFDTIKLLLEKAPGLDNDSTSQFIAFRRKDCDLINHVCCHHYSGHYTKDSKNKTQFQCRDKVCSTKNGYVTKYTEDFRSSASSTQSRSSQNDGSQKSQEKDKLERIRNPVRLCNGEIYFIRQDYKNESGRYLTLVDLDDQCIHAHFKELQRECRLKHAWARTIHTFQGSEAETVVYVVGTASWQDWQHIYTAVTRGRQRVYVVAQEHHLRKVMSTKNPSRNTCLKQYLKENLKHLRPTYSREAPSQMFSSQASQMPKNPENMASKPSTSTSDLSSPFSAVPGHHTSPVPRKGPAEESWRKEEDLDKAVAVSDNENPKNAIDCVTGLDDKHWKDQSCKEKNNFNTTSVPPSPSQKRLQTLSDGNENPSKCLKVAEKESPLGCSRLQRLSLENLQPKQLFKP